MKYLLIIPSMLYALLIFSDMYSLNVRLLSKRTPKSTMELTFSTCKVYALCRLSRVSVHYYPTKFGTHEDERTVLFITISLDGIKPNTNPKTNPNHNTRSSF